jgi:hypothetical protein
MKRLINFLTLLILITILSIIAIFITSCNGVLVGVPGSGGGGGAGSGEEIKLSLSSGSVGTAASQPNSVNNNAPSELANGLLDSPSNSLFILGNDYPAGSNPNPNVYLFQFIPPNTFNGPLTINFTSGTNIQRGNLYIDQDNSGNIYVMGSHIKSITDSDIFIAKINKNPLSFNTNFRDNNSDTQDGIVLLDKGNSETPGGLLVGGTNNVLYVAGYNNQGKVIIFKLNTDTGNRDSTFDGDGYVEIDIDSNTQERATDILTDGTNLIIVGEQQNIFTTKLMLFKVNLNNGSVVPNSLITIDPPSGESFVAAPLDAVILNNKIIKKSI